MTETYFGLPAEVRFCRQCVISNQRPSSTVEFRSAAADTKSVIRFDDSNLCEACRYAEQKDQAIDWRGREEHLLRLLDRFRRTDGGYDVIVPGSGGKDSAFTAHVLKYKYGMNPLTVTWAPHLYTDIGWRNFQNWIHVGGLDNILFTPNGRVHRLLTKEAFHNLLHPFQPFIVGQRMIGPKFAARYGVKLVMYGENQAEYGNRVEENQDPRMRAEFFAVDGAKDVRLGGRPIPELISNHRLRLADFEPYLPMQVDDTTACGIEVHYLGFYLKWDPQECYYYAVEHTGFQANPERTEGSYSKYSSIDDKIDPFHYYTTLIKFGLGRASYDAAQEIRNGKISREEGVALVRKYDLEFPQKYFQEFLEYIDTSEADFHARIDQFRSPHLWERRESGWQLRHPIWASDSDKR
jgi:N-acetyl sugar amidotransferase